MMMLHENTRLVIVSAENFGLQKWQNDKIVLKYDKICSKSY